MPTTINGIGTMYIGRRNESSSTGQCEFCGQETTLSDYETTLFFTVVFIPLIPLGKKQVLGDCALCRQHRVASADDWARVRDNQIEAARRTAGQSGDAAGLIELIQTCGAFHRDDEAAAAARELEERFGRDASVQFFLGAWHEHRRNTPEAHRHFREAFRLEPGEWAYRRAVALCDLEMNDPATAAALLKDAAPPSPHFEPGLFVLLARGYQQRGQHDQAHRVLTDVLRASPAMSANKDFRQTIRASEKALGIMQSAVPNDPIWRSGKFWGVTAALLLIAVIWGSNYFISRNRTAYVVNGLGVPLTVVLDGQELTVPPRAWQTTSLAEGKHTAGVKQPLEIADEEFEVRAGWFDRFLSKPALVIDPARSAAVIWESAHYSANPMDTDDEEPKVHVGQLYTQYDDVDYLFEPFPQQLTVDSKSKKVRKTRVGLLPAEQAPLAAMNPDLPAADRMAFLEVHLRTMTGAELGTNRLPMMAYLSLAATEKQPERRDQLLRARLTERPPLVEWHRMYQQVREADGATDELVREYDAMLAEAPGDAAMLYLRGRVDPEPRKALELFRKSRDADPKFGYAWGAIAFHQNLEGEFAPALESLKKAVASEPGNPELLARLRDARFAAEEFDALEQELKAERAKEADSLGPINGLFEVYCRTGKRDDAEKLLAAFKASSRVPRGLPTGMPRPAGPSDSERLAEATLRYFQGDLAGLEKTTAAISDESDRQFWQDVLRLEQGQAAQVQEFSTWGGDDAGFLDLCRYLDSAAAGKPDEASTALAKAVTAFQGASPNKRIIAELLQQPALADDDPSRLELTDPSQKSLVLTTLAVHHAVQRPKLLDLAQRLNYRLTFPHGLVNRHIAQVRKLPAGTGKEDRPKTER
jgi:tetratricopeptide (TPR) repeat protein